MPGRLCRAFPRRNGQIPGSPLLPFVTRRCVELSRAFRLGVRIVACSPTSRAPRPSPEVTVLDAPVQMATTVPAASTHDATVLRLKPAILTTACRPGGTLHADRVTCVTC